MTIFVLDLLKDLDSTSVEPLEFSAFETWLLLSSVQTTWRMPTIGRELRDHLYVIGHVLQSQFDHKPALAILAETGWDMGMDIPTKDRR